MKLAIFFADHNRGAAAMPLHDHALATADSLLGERPGDPDLVHCAAAS